MGFFGSFKKWREIWVGVLGRLGCCFFLNVLLGKLERSKILGYRGVFFCFWVLFMWGFFWRYVYFGWKGFRIFVGYIFDYVMF